MTLSIIVPVYNVEKYLDECIESIIGQSFTDFELILVNDGSKDSSGKICDEWATKDNRIKVIHKENSGPSRARESGIKAAKGKFLAFVDSDDKIEKDMYSVMMTAQQKNDYDYVICGLKRFFTDKDDIREEPAGDYSAETPDEVLSKLIFPMVYRFDDEHFVSQSSTKNIYKKEIFEKYHIQYKSLDLYFSEDLILNIDYLIKCQNAISIPDTNYMYRANIESFTHTIPTTDIKLNSIFNMYDYVLKLFISSDDIKNRISIYCLELLSVFMRHVVKNSSFTDSYKRIKEICHNQGTELIMAFSYDKMSAKNKLIKFLIKNKCSALLTAMIWLYNKIYIER